MGALPHAGQRLVDNLQHSQQGFGPSGLANFGQIDAMAVASDEGFGAAANTGDQTVAHGGQQLFEDTAGIGTAGQRIIKGTERGLRVTGNDGLEEPPDFLLTADPDDGLNGVDVDRSGSTRRQTKQLFQQGLAVPHAAGRPAGNHAESSGAGLNPFGFHNLRESLADGGSID